MVSSTKHFAERLNQCLDEIDAPSSIRERSVILSKILDIPKQQAWSLLEGQITPNQDLIQQLAEEFEVEEKWLSGEQK